MNKNKIEHIENQIRCYRKQAEKFFKERKYKESCTAWQTFAYFVASKEVLEKVNMEGEKRIKNNKGGI